MRRIHSPIFLRFYYNFASAKHCGDAIHRAQALCCSNADIALCSAAIECDFEWIGRANSSDYLQAICSVKRARMPEQFASPTFRKIQLFFKK